MITYIAVTLLVAIVVSCLFYGRQKHQYWESKGIWSPPKLPIVGNILDLMIRKFRWEYLDKIYVEHMNKKVWGMYSLWKPIIFINDLELLKNIMTKHADHFTDRVVLELSEKDRVLKEFLTLLKGESWKALRNIMTPTFSSGKIKKTFPLVDSKIQSLIEKCNEKMEQDGYVETKHVLSLYTMDIITTCAFGIDVNCMKNEESEILKAAYQSQKVTISAVIKFIVMTTFPKLSDALGIIAANDSLLFLEKCILETIKSRQESGITRDDFLDLMLNALKDYEENKSTSDLKYDMTLNTIVSSSVLFLLAGYDTTSNALSFATYLLAKNTECQDELRSEIQNIKDSEGGLNYQNIMEAKYLDACFSETLRMFGPAHFLERICTKDYKIPDIDFVIPKDMSVNIPSWSLHYDPQYWEEPRSFKPERFLPENKHKIFQYAYLPFGHGPRNCIGMRFALMEAKLALAHLVLHFEMSLQPGFEMQLEGSMAIIKPDTNGIKIVMEPVNQCNDTDNSGQQSD